MSPLDEETIDEAFDKSKAISREFKENPTIENYVRLRRENPDVEIEPSIYGGIDHAFSLENDLEGMGIDIKLYVSTLDANEAAISKLSLQLLENIIFTRTLAQQGETHLAGRGKVIPDHLIDWLTCSMLDALSWNDDLYIPRDLIVLIRSRLIKGHSDIETAVSVRAKKNHAAMIAGQLLVQNIRPSFRSVAKIMEVQPSTVKRWFSSEEEFLGKAGQWESFYSPGGMLHEIWETKLKTLHKK